MKKKKSIRKFLVAILVMSTIFSLCFSAVPVFASSQTITNDTFWKDTSGNPIYSQGGGIFKFGSTYYWYGVKYNGAVTYYNNPTKLNSDSSFASITCYSSKDLVNWTFVNNIMTASTPGLEGCTWLGRLGVCYNSTTKKYVLISQFCGNNGSGDMFATCSTPGGDFTYDHVQTSFPGIVNNGTGDQSLFIDDDGTPYLICSSTKGRAYLYVVPFNSSDYLSLGTPHLVFKGVGREGNCMFKYNGRYYFCSSDLHGWNASHCYVISSDSIEGTYSGETVMDGTDSDFCHVSQTGFFVTVAGTSGTTVLFCGDRWCDFAGNGFGYNQWCPLSFNGTTPTFNSLTNWNLDASAGTWSVGSSNNYVLNPGFEADRVTQSTAAGWSMYSNQGAATNKNVLNGGYTGRFCWSQSNASAYSASTYQTVTGLPNGIYTLSCYVKSSSGQTTCQLFAKGYGGDELDTSLNTPISGWTKKTISGIAVTNHQCQIGIYSVANAGNWCRFDDFLLVKN